MRRALTIIGTVLLVAALVLAFLGHSDQAFVVAAGWIIILVTGLVTERMIAKRRK